MGTICGIDEVGRGPLAGPVTAAAVVLPPGFDVAPLADSKALTAPARERVYRLLCDAATPVGVGWAWPEEIDRLNIHRATLLAMRRAWESLDRLIRRRVARVLVDGKFAPELLRSSDPAQLAEAIPVVEAIIRGDSLVPEIMAASIAAKVTRDRWMSRYAWIEPAYGYDRHSGYPTAAHRRVCTELGPSPIQRMSFTVRSDG